MIEPSGKTRWSPKEHLFPRSEALYRYSLKGDTVVIEDPAGPEQSQVLFAVRGCDAAGLARLDDIFLSDRKDPLYAARREATTVVAAGCAAADPECFCTAVGGSPVGTEGADLQLLPLGEESWLLTALNGKGEALVGDAAASWSKGGKKELGRADELAQAVSEPIARNPIQHEWSELLEAGFETPSGTGSPSTVWAAACAPTSAPVARVST